MQGLLGKKERKLLTLLYERSSIVPPRLGTLCCRKVISSNRLQIHHGKGTTCRLYGGKHQGFLQNTCRSPRTAMRSRTYKTSAWLMRKTKAAKSGSSCSVITMNKKGKVIIRMVRALKSEPLTHKCVADGSKLPKENEGTGGELQPARKPSCAVHDSTQNQKWTHIRGSARENLDLLATKKTKLVDKPNEQVEHKLDLLQADMPVPNPSTRPTKAKPMKKSRSVEVQKVRRRSNNLLNRSCKESTKKNTRTILSEHKSSPELLDTSLYNFYSASNNANTPSFNTSGTVIELRPKRIRFSSKEMIYPDVSKLGRGRLKKGSSNMHVPGRSANDEGGKPVENTSNCKHMKAVEAQNLPKPNLKSDDTLETPLEELSRVRVYMKGSKSESRLGQMVVSLNKCEINFRNVFDRNLDVDFAAEKNEHKAKNTVFCKADNFKSSHAKMADDSPKHSLNVEPQLSKEPEILSLRKSESLTIHKCAVKRLKRPRNVFYEAQVKEKDGKTITKLRTKKGRGGQSVLHVICPENPDTKTKVNHGTLTKSKINGRSTEANAATSGSLPKLKDQMVAEKSLQEQLKSSGKIGISLTQSSILSLGGDRTATKLVPNAGSSHVLKKPVANNLTTPHSEHACVRPQINSHSEPVHMIHPPVSQSFPGSAIRPNVNGKNDPMPAINARDGRAGLSDAIENIHELAKNFGFNGPDMVSKPTIPYKIENSLPKSIGDLPSTQSKSFGSRVNLKSVLSDFELKEHEFENMQPEMKKAQQRKVVKQIFSCDAKFRNDDLMNSNFPITPTEKLNIEPKNDLSLAHWFKQENDIESTVEQRREPNFQLDISQKGRELPQANRSRTSTMLGQCGSGSQLVRQSCDVGDVFSTVPESKIEVPRGDGALLTLGNMSTRRENAEASSGNGRWSVEGCEANASSVPTCKPVFPPPCNSYSAAAPGASQANGRGSVEDCAANASFVPTCKPVFPPSCNSRNTPQSGDGCAADSSWVPTCKPVFPPPCNVCSTTEPGASQANGRWSFEGCAANASSVPTCKPVFPPSCNSRNTPQPGEGCAADSSWVPTCKPVFPPPCNVCSTSENGGSKTTFPPQCYSSTPCCPYSDQNPHEKQSTDLQPTLCCPPPTYCPPPECPCAPPMKSKTYSILDVSNMALPNAPIYVDSKPKERPCFPPKPPGEQASQPLHSCWQLDRPCSITSQPNQGTLGMYCKYASIGWYDATKTYICHRALSLKHFLTVFVTKFLAWLNLQVHLSKKRLKMAEACSTGNIIQSSINVTNQPLIAKISTSLKPPTEKNKSMQNPLFKKKIRFIKTEKRSVHDDQSRQAILLEEQRRKATGSKANPALAYSEVLNIVFNQKNDFASTAHEQRRRSVMN